MVRHIRPHHLFTRVVTPSYGERLVSIVLPHDKTPKLLETAVLLSLERLVGARRVFELGTYLGIQTLNLAANVGEGGVVYTLDLDDEAAARATQVAEDRAITERSLRQAGRRAFASSPYAARVVQLLGDSNDLDATPYLDSIDLVYVDGGHDERTVRADSASAFRMLSKTRPAAICWHDYGSATYPDVTRVLEEMSEERALYHVEETMMCFTLQGFDPELVLGAG